MRYAVLVGFLKDKCETRHVVQKALRILKLRTLSRSIPSGTRNVEGVRNDV